VSSAAFAAAPIVAVRASSSTARRTAVGAGVTCRRAAIARKRRGTEPDEKAKQRTTECGRPLPPTIVRRTYLELRSPAELRPARASDIPARIERLDPCPIEMYRALYSSVGEQWHWRDRLAWDDEQLARHLTRDAVGVFVMRVGSEVAGYFELEKHDDGSVEIAYFGLRPEFFGRGLGGELLTRAAGEAWREGATRVWLHTCTLDSPRALPNYLARGFRPYREESYTVDLPAAQSST
jgi:GNAT superfamily N-acetyltransferase